MTKEKKDPHRDSLGRRAGPGRPKGSTNIYSNESVKKLAELGFDPITMMVDKYHEIDALLNGDTVRHGSGAHAQLIATQQKIINDLMRYGYRQVPDKQEITVENRKPIAVKLTSRKEKPSKDKTE